MAHSDHRDRAVAELAQHQASAELDWWKMKYRILAKILHRHGIPVIEDEHGNIDVQAMRAGGFIPPRN